MHASRLCVCNMCTRMWPLLRAAMPPPPLLLVMLLLVPLLLIPSPCWCWCLCCLCCLCCSALGAKCHEVEVLKEKAMQAEG